MNSRLTILQGDSAATLKTLAAGSVQCCVTSPPYFGLRSYLPTEHLLKPLEIGCEKTPQEYVEKLVAVFREVRRVLREDGVLWLNLGDSFAGGAGRGNSPPSGKQQSNHGTDFLCGKPSNIPEGLKPKDLIGIPWMVAFALRADGWYLRQWMPWVKRNAMPESVTDRPASSCETFFLLSKSEQYFYDYVAVRKPASEALLNQIEEGYRGESTKEFFEAKAQDASSTKGRIIDGMRKRIDKQRGHARRHNGFNDRWDGLTNEEQMACGSNRRNGDWFFDSIKGFLSDENGGPLALVENTNGYKEAHFATFPRKLIEPCILAGTSARGCCPACGAPWERVTETTGRTGKDWNASSLAKNTTDEIGHAEAQASPIIYTETIGWQPTCSCPAAEPVPGTVLDPFGGSGTVGEVALEYGRKAIICELNPEYLPMIEQRTNITPGLGI